MTKSASRRPCSTSRWKSNPGFHRVPHSFHATAAASRESTSTPSQSNSRAVTENTRHGQPAYSRDSLRPGVVILRHEHRPLRKDRTRHRFDPGHRAGHRSGTRAGRGQGCGERPHQVSASTTRAAQIQGDVIGVAADVTTDDGVAALLAQLPSVDILVNNLGIFEAVPARGDHRRPVAPILRRQRALGGAADPQLSARNGRKGLGQSDSDRQRLGARDTRGDDPLRRVQDRPAGCHPRLRQGCGGHRRDGELGDRRAHAHGRCRGLRLPVGRQDRCRGTRRSASSCVCTARSHCCSG